MKSKFSVLLGSLVGLLILVACFGKPGSPGSSLFVTLQAQQVPVTKNVTWDPNPASDGVLNYVVMLDGTTIGTPTGVIQTVTFQTSGPHTISVFATNIWGNGPAANLTVNVAVPGKPTNPRIP